MDEQPTGLLSPSEYVVQCAESKARSIDSISAPGSLIVAADTVVALGNQIYGKPQNSADAIRMLQELSGKTHYVYSGLVMIQAERCERQCVATKVVFATLTTRQIERYVQTGEPLDKAGAYGIQGLGAFCVERIEGCYFNVVGLPLRAVVEMLARFGVELP